MHTGAQLFVEALQRLGIDRIFTLVGDHLNEVLAEAARAGVDIIHMRHESGVTHAADAYARITRRPAIAVVTGGPGHTNSLTGIATAYLACSPLIAVSGSRANSVADRQGFQDIDQLGMTRPVVKWAAQPFSAAQIPFYLARAYAEATAARMGPVHLTIPVDIFSAFVSESPVMPPITPAQLPPASETEIGAALDLIRTAERPIVIAGSGVWWSDAGTELKQFIEHMSLPLYTITMARGVVPDDHPLCLGYADPALNRAAHRAFQDADLFLILGKRIDFRLGFGGPRVLAKDAKCIQVDIHPQEFGMNRAIDLAILADVKKALEQLLKAAAAPEPRTAWLKHLHALHEDWRQAIRKAAFDTGHPMHPAAFYAELREHLPRETLFSWDGGDFTHWGRAGIPALHAGGWLRLGPLAAIGSALPNGIALKLAHPDQPVAVITGDGALGFYIAELETAVRYKLPLIIIVGNDSGWGLERELQRAQMDHTVACELSSTRYDIVMKGFGGDGESVESLDQIPAALQRALRSSVPYLLNVIVRGVRSPFTEWTLAGKQKRAS
ncbi:MAG: thiamine pyrophosphate-binding protein [Acidobacteriaceae bacterium]|nr:thiamine pyrophosphate-binding protein [Acidobacteriaceae bacterium]